ncbi:MAG TPA: anaerobic ribonucleoside-triphosphate reductase activating protein [Smithellaceae bacterium]|jgi:pyruvate formate lyase activating enzyme|nr:anaerobic ribonucleoside-triphosphate reductase activating protein [Syntrophaceae bacterium]HPL96817.1 anaerobic ribonucleoside-triphosphate reductase activating protein [Smithellaceae bacterium]HPV49991.1 anaerobic ribonucleoside-triphosphate reductase activating protein [Smithellaceae bacterium]
MKIGGLQKLSLIDYPEKISAVIFTQGCNFRCPYCHNPQLVDVKLYQPCLEEKDIFRFLENRRGRLDAVVITGGEPALQDDLIPFIMDIRRLGFAVKLDTNGSRPRVLERLLRDGLVDFIAMDVKAPLEKYPDVVRAPLDKDDLRESIRLVIGAKIPHEFRTTAAASLLRPEDILTIAREIDGAKRYALQRFQPGETLETIFAEEKTFSDEEFVQIKNQLAGSIPVVIVR